ncbi:hypothetical protein TUN199_11830 [Pyrenophora tritici-repentis]|nr:hypothetical protein Alg130_11912 [Pyrenophora tritici-repentis]KAI0603964.1 hypothetical protein TUN205_11790 [Pyrenophora tritici-repentis]KAI0616181.1 hypothetical protein TUN199_11830 [Pyrenophora tritici-repentis]
MRIYAYKDDVKAYNHRRLRELGRPVLLVNTSHSGGVPAERANTEEAGNLHKEIPISINARVMLRENLWIERRLFNGATHPLLSSLTSTTMRVTDLTFFGTRIQTVPWFPYSV